MEITELQQHYRNITITIITITNHGPKSIILRKQLRQTTIVIVQSKLVIVDPLVPENFPL